ncbi:MAG: extracellular solute-binding protein, partial [Anaerolineae bacterium]
MDQGRNMPPQLDWQIGDDGHWEEQEPGELLPPPQPSLLRRIARRVPRWAWYALLGAVVVAALGFSLSVWQHYAAAKEQLIFQIQSVVDLEAQAFERRDGELLAAQLDAQAGPWEREQRARLFNSCRSALGTGTPLLDRCAPILPAQVVDVELREDVAWVEVVEGDPAVRRARFYRRTEQGWLHTSPKAGFWQPAAEKRRGSLTIYGSPRDVRHAGAMLDQIAGTMADVCPLVGCPPDARLRVEFAARQTADQLLPWFEGNRLRVDSPWLLGIPAEQTMGRMYRRLLAYATVDGVVRQALGVGDGLRATRLQRALVDEFVFWYISGRDASTVPLLGRIIERNGAEALPEVMGMAAEDPSLDVFLSAWLGVSADEGDPEGMAAYFQAVLDVEREAMQADRRETYRLFQFEPGPEYIGSHRGGELPQESVLLDLQQADGLATLPAVRVASVEIEGDVARVTLAPVPSLPSLLPPVEFFYRQEGAWKHSMPYYALDYANLLSEQHDDRERGEVTIRFGCSSSEWPVFQRWAEQFGEGHPGIEVQVIPVDRLVPVVPGIDADREWAYRTMSHLDVAPQYLSLADMIDEGWVSDLGPWIAQDGDLEVDDFYPGLLEEGRQGDGTWSLPLYADASVLFYDKDAFDAAGVPYPRPGWTQDAFLAAAQALTVRRGDDAVRYGFADAGLGSFAFVRSRVGDALGGSGAAPKVDLRSAAVVDAVRWYTDLALAHGVMPHPQALGFEEPGLEYNRAIRQLIEDKEAAMWSESISSWPFRAQQFNLGVVPYPVAVRAVNPLQAARPYVMNAHTAHPEACWLWMAYLTRQYTPYLSEFTIVLPVRRSLAEQVDDFPQLDPELAATVRYVLEHPWVRTDADPVGPIYDAIYAVYRGVPVEDALAEAQASW